MPVDNLEGFTVGVTYFGDMNDLVNPTVVSPDAGGVYRYVLFILLLSLVCFRFPMLVLWLDEGQFVVVVALTSIIFPLSCLLSTLSLSAKQFRDLLARKYGVDSGLAMIIKQRAKANEIDRMDLVGNVQGSDCILGE